MGSYSTKVSSPYKTATYKDIKDIYMWIIDVYKLLGGKESDVSSCFLYDIGDINCSSDSFDEFTENAFGQDINLTHIRLNNFESKETFHIYISISPKRAYEDKNVSFTCDSRMELSQVLDKITELSETKDESTPTITTQNNYIDNVVIMDNATIHDSNIGGHKNRIIKQQDKKQNFWQRVWQNVISNLLWWIAAAILLVAIGTLLAVNPSSITDAIIRR